MNERSFKNGWRCGSLPSPFAYNPRPRALNHALNQIQTAFLMIGVIFVPGPTYQAVSMTRRPAGLLAAVSTSNNGHSLTFPTRTLMNIKNPAVSIVASLILAASFYY